MGGRRSSAWDWKAAPAALVLRSPFTSLADMGRLHYPWLPLTDRLLRAHFVSLEQNGQVRCQVLARHDFDPSAPAGRPSSLLAQSYQPRLPARPEAHVWVPQLEPTDCGLAALAMVGRRLGAKVSVEDLRAQAAPGPGG